MSGMDRHRRTRVLFSAVGGHGHLDPLLPLADAAAADGHQVLVTGAAALAEHVAGHGLPFVASGPDLVSIQAPLTLHDLDHERDAIGRHFAARLGHERAAAVLAIAQSWNPDVIVRDEVDFGAAVAAEVIGLPHAAVVVLAAGGFIVREVADGPLRALREAFGLPPEDGMAMLHRHLTLTPFPAAYRDPAFPVPGNLVAYRTDGARRNDGRSAETVVFVTLGTIFNTESGDLMQRLVAGAAACSGVDRVVAATGPHIAVEELGAQPDHVTVHGFVPQDEVLATCAAVVSHAGSGTVLGALSHGLPMVCLPMGADQLLNGARYEQLGLGLRLPPDTVRPEDVTAALTAVLSEDSYRDAARRMQEEWQRLPAVAVALDAVLDLVR
jgi:UDP:flavonoid glycosyltransferase YjiC (YdhE family)